MADGMTTQQVAVFAQRLRFHMENNPGPDPVPSWVFNAESAARRGFEWLDADGRVTDDVWRCRCVRCKTCGHRISLKTSFIRYARHHDKHTKPAPLTVDALRALPIAWGPGEPFGYVARRRKGVRSTQTLDDDIRSTDVARKGVVSTDTLGGGVI